MEQLIDESQFLKIGFFIHIGKPLNTFYQITAREPFDYETGEETTAYFSAVSAGGESGFKNIELLEPDKTPLHLLQAYMGVTDTLMKVYVKIDTGTNRWGVDDDKDVGFVDGKRSPPFDMNPQFVLWLINDFFPAINVKNVSPVSLTPKIFFTGMKYDITEVKDPTLLGELNTGKRPCRRIVIGGLQTSSKV